MPQPDYSSTLDAEEPSAWVQVLPIAVILAVYLATFHLLPHEGFWINDNGCKFIQLQGLIRTGYSDFSIPWPGNDLDPSFSYNPLPSPFGHVIDGRLYATFSPVFPLLSSVGYRVWGFAGLYILPFVGGLLTLPAVWSLTALLVATGPARRLAQPLSILIVALCTPMWFYSVTFWEHVPAVCLATWSVACCVHFIVRRSLGRLVAGAVLCGLSVYLRDELYLLGAILAVVSAVSSRKPWRSFLIFAGVFILTIIPLCAFQWAALGHPFGYHFRADSPLTGGWLGHLSDRWQVVNRLLFNCHENMWLSGAISIPYLALFIFHPRVSGRAFKWVVALLAAFATLSGAVIILGHLTADSPVRWLLNANGLFAVSPILILAFVREKAPDEHRGQGPVLAPQQRIERALWLIALLYVLSYALLTPRLHASGIHWGCRYLLPVFPLMGVLASVKLARWWAAHPARLGRAVLCLTVVLSVATQLYSLTLLHGRKSFSAVLNRAVAEQPEEIIIAWGGFVPQHLSHCFFDKKIFLMRSQRQRKGLISMLRKGGESEALLVISDPDFDAVERGGRIVDDGHLTFISVELRHVQLQQ
jgi:hypothetical protein